MATVIDAIGPLGADSGEAKFYVYAHVRNDTGRVFYIGKGHGRRAWVTRRRNQHWSNIANKAGYQVEILKGDLTEKEALAMEIKTIAEIGLDNLCNMTIGGDGTAGFKMNEDQKRVLVANLTGRILSAETRKKISEANSGLKRDRSVVEAHANMLRGRKHSIEHVEKIRNSGIGRVFSEETRRKISASNTGKVASVESRERMSKAHAGKTRSIESREKQSSSLLLRVSGRKDEIYGKRMRAVLCSNGMKFKSISDAGRWADAELQKSNSKFAISKCAAGGRKTACGFIWTFIEAS